MLFTMTNITHNTHNTRFDPIDPGSTPTPLVRRWWLRFEEKWAKG